MAKISKSKPKSPQLFMENQKPAAGKVSEKAKIVKPRKQTIKNTTEKTDSSLENPAQVKLPNRPVANVKVPNPRQVRPIIQVKNLVKNFGKFVAVDDVSFDVKKGEIFGILGPNGAGKTTTLEMIETLTSKTSGQIFIDGLNVDTYPEHVKKIVGIQLQSSGFYPRINLVETLDLFASIYNVKIDPIELLKSVNLADKAKTIPEKLSGGQRQRFSIVTTLVGDPLIVFLDEPTTGLDPQARRNLWEMIRELKNKGKTIVLTTHYMDEAEALCDRIAIMDGGKILEINTVEGYIQNLLNKGFVRPQPKLGATLDDVFLDLTGKQLRE